MRVLKQKRNKNWLTDSGHRDEEKKWARETQLESEDNEDEPKLSSIGWDCHSSAWIRSLSFIILINPFPDRRLFFRIGL